MGFSAQVCLPADARAFTHMWSTRPWLNKEDRFDRVKQALEDTDADLIFIDEPGLFTEEAFFKDCEPNHRNEFASTINLVRFYFGVQF